MRRYLPTVAGAALCFVGCAAPHQSRVTTTRPPLQPLVVRTLAVYPLLTAGSDAPQATYRPLGSLDRRDDKIYIQPPSETDLKVTGTSQQITDLLEAELSLEGFRVKILPVELPDDDDPHAEAFCLSLGTLAELRRGYGLEAVVLGSVATRHDPYDRHRNLVTAANLKLVDVATLDVLGHVSLREENGIDLDRAARELAAALASLPRSPES